MSDELWDRLEPLLPRRERRFRYPGRKPLPVHTWQRLHEDLLAELNAALRL